jgi:hypothetical protein
LNTIKWSVHSRRIDPIRLNMPVLPGRPERRRSIPDTHRSEASPERATKRSVIVTNEIIRHRLPWKCLRDLPSGSACAASTIASALAIVVRCTPTTAATLSRARPFELVENFSGCLSLRSPCRLLAPARSMGIQLGIRVIAQNHRMIGDDACNPVLARECSSSTCSSRGAGLKPRTCFFVINSASR